MRKKLNMKMMYMKPVSEAIYIGMMPMMSNSLKDGKNILSDANRQQEVTAPETGGSEGHSGGEGDDLDAAKRYGWYTGEFGE